MIGLLIIVSGVIYLLLWVATVYGTYRLSLRVNESKRLAQILASIACLAMYLIPFWDLVPTLIIHKQYCDTQAGFRVYKTAEQWSVENPGVLESLTPYKKFVPLELDLGSGTKKNERFGSISRAEDFKNFPVRELRSTLIDIEMQDVIAENIDFQRGYGAIGLGHEGWWKFWLAASSCYSGQESAVNIKNRRNYYQDFKMRWSY